MKLQSPDHTASALITRKSETSIQVTLQPYSLTQTSIVFPLDREADAMQLVRQWLFKNEVPDRQNFRKRLKAASLLGLIIMATALGCGREVSKADYVTAHHCDLRGVTQNSTFYFSGSTHVIYGTHVYECPNDVTVVIENNEPQPSIIKTRPII